MAEVGRQLADLFGASGVTDAEPLTTTIDAEHRVYVKSISRGRIQIGRLNDLALLAISSNYADELESALRRLTANATAERQAAAEVRRARARALKAEGLSVAQIAAKMTAERNDPQRAPIDPRQVRRWVSRKKT